MIAISRRTALRLGAGAGASAFFPLRASARTAREALESHAAATRANIVFLRHGELVAEAGDVARKLPAYSVRKSLLSTLYGWAVAQGRIRLDATLAELGIDDVPPSLTEAERRASVRELLTCRSGVYHPAAYETRTMRESRPARGSHAPGSHWYYNNWDFNALGTIYERATGEGIFASFERRIAREIGLTDFTSADCAYVREPASQHPAYTFRLTARDLARFGELMRRGGEWQGRRVVPADWIAEATRMHTPTDSGRRGYGYMWWTISNDSAAGYFASGNNGQLMAVLPATGIVLAQLRPRDASDGHTGRFLRLARELAAG